MNKDKKYTFDPDGGVKDMPILHGKRSRHSITVFAIMLASFLIAGIGPLKAETIACLNADAEVGPVIVSSGADPMQCGYVSGTGVNTVLVFLLPTLPSGQRIGTASFSIWYMGSLSSPAFDCDLYGLPGRAASAVLTSDYYAGTGDATATLLQSSFVTLQTSMGTVSSGTAGSKALADLLNAQYASVGAGSYIFVRISPNKSLANNYSRYKFHSSEYSNASLRPLISYTTVPITYSIATSSVPSVAGSTAGAGSYDSGSTATVIATPNDGWVFVNWTDNGTEVSTTGTYSFTVSGDRTLTANFRCISYNVAVGGGGAVTGVYADPTTSGRFYMRTDVGGVFRMDSGATEWKPICENFSYTNKGNDYGIESVAIDPNNAGTIYVYTGKYNYTNYYSHIYKSTNGGDSWVAKSIPTGLQGLANLTDHARRGEKLVVDPNNSNVLYLASLNLGLWKSTNGAASWTKVMSSGTTPFPDGDGSGQSTYGLSFVAFDKTGGLSGTVSAIGYVGVYGTSADCGVWKTVDGGGTWSQMSGGFTNPARGTVASDGTLYVTFFTNGGVCKALRESDVLAACAPSSTCSYCALTVDPVSPQILYVSEYSASYGDATWRSDDGGGNWTVVGNVHGTGNAGTRQGSQWFGRISQLAINPFNTNEIWMGDWLGVLRTTDITNTSSPWNYIYQGHEEIVPLALRCAPSGAPLLSGAADVNGLRHVDIDQYPSTSFATASGSTTIGSTTGLDFCENDPNLWVKVGYVISGGVTAYSSTNNGVNWKQLPSIPSGASGGRISISANNASNLVWKCADGTVYYTINGGTNWYEATGYPKLACGEWDTTRQGLTSNRVTDGVFYILGTSGTLGYVYRSTDGGATWASYSNAISVGGVANPANYTLLAMPGNADELWLTVSGGGVLKSTDGGLTFSSVPGASGYMLAFGKAASGHTNPAVFLKGTATESTLRSDDDGATWVDITDPDMPINNNAKLFSADAQVFGRYYVGTDGRGIYVGESE